MSHISPSIPNKAIGAITVFLATFILAFISGSTFFSVNNSSAENRAVSVTANINSTMAITTNALNNELILDITPSPSGTQTSGDIIVTVSTNNPTGYSLTLNSTSDSTNPLVPLVNESDSGEYIPSTANSWGSAAALQTNTWGVSVWGQGQSTSSTTFSSVPRLTAPEQIRLTDTSDTNSTTTLTFATKADHTKTNGAYTNIVVFTATANSVPTGLQITSISPATNWTGGEIYLTGTNFPTTDVNVSITVGGTPCASYRLISDTSAICVLPAKGTGTVNAVAITSGALISNSNRTVTYDGANKGSMQQFDTNTCAAMPMGLAQIWTDARNNAVYRVKKMLDNKCWMIDNLAYAGDGNNFYGDTHVLNFSTACGTDNWDAASGTVTNCGTFTAWPANYTTRHITTNNVATGIGTLPDRMGNPITNTTGSTNNSSPTFCGSGATGSGIMLSECLTYFYSWCAAIGLDSGTNPTCNDVQADSTTSDSNGSYTGGSVNTGMAGTGIVGKPGGIGGESKGNAQAANQDGIATANGSICPAGWRLPVGRVGTSDTSTSNLYNEWNILSESLYSRTLFTNTDSTTINTGTNWASNFYPTGSFSAISSGYFYTTTGLAYLSTAGYYWTSSANARSAASTTRFSAAAFDPGTNNNTKYNGMAVRCVLN